MLFSEINQNSELQINIDIAEFFKFKSILMNKVELIKNEPYQSISKIISQKTWDKISKFLKQLNYES